MSTIKAERLLEKILERENVLVSSMEDLMNAYIGGNIQSCKSKKQFNKLENECYLLQDRFIRIKSKYRSVRQDLLLQLDRIIEKKMPIREFMIR